MNYNVGDTNQVIKGGVYLTVEQYRRKIGLSNTRTIYRALKSGRILGAKKIGKIWIIPSSAVMLDARIKHGIYLGITKRLSDYKNSIEK